MHVFTSITSNYLPKARVLAKSVKRHAPRSMFHLLLCDRPPAGFDLSREPFDHLIELKEYPVDNRLAWIFQHNVVELCTAVKGWGFQRILDQHDADAVIYLDPDVVLFSPLQDLAQMLEGSSILVTPHQTEPEQDPGAVIDNEVSSLKHGVFNLGFLAVRNCPEGRRFIDWWAARLRDFCFDDRGQGLFTDQKWVDLAPAFFPGLGIVREPQFNVSTWNISHRELTGDPEGGMFVNGKPLCFYHFSGFDSGAMKVMSEVYGTGSLLAQLRRWYIRKCAENGQEELGSLDCFYDFYSDGGRIRPAERWLYRHRGELASRFPDPYDCSDRGGYRAWFREHAGTAREQTSTEELLQITRSELESIQHSISWRIFRRMTTAYRRFGSKIGLGRILRRLSRP